MKYVKGVTLWDSYNQLFETKIGTKASNFNQMLCYSAWGKTKEESKERAETLITILTVAGK